MKAAHRALVEACEAGRFDARAAAESDARIDRLLAFCSKAPPPRVTDSAQARMLQFLLAKRALEIRDGGRAHIPIAPGTQVAVVYPRLDRIEGLLVEDEGRDLGKLIRAYFEPSEIRATLHPFQPDGEPDEVREVFHAVKGAELIVLVVFHAAVYARERELLEALEAFDDRLIVLVTRNPLDAELIESSPTVVITHGFRTFQIGVAIETLCGRLD
jgi:hypothetical protein